MAKQSVHQSYSNFTFDFKAMTMAEMPKKKDDEIKVYDLKKILQELDGMSGLYMSIKSDSDIEPDSTEY